MEFVDELRAFSDQLRWVVENYRPASLPESVKAVVLGGMGGSGIAADFVRAEVYESAPFPVEVVKDYALPAWVDAQTLVIITSYSGNTEESLALFEAAKAKGASVVVISTGGRLGEAAEAEGIPFFRIPAGFQPRMALGYSLGMQMMIMGGLLGNEWTPEYLRTLAAETADTADFERRAEEWDEAADSGARWVIFTDRKNYPVGLRFMQQINENAKTEGAVHLVPEFNHNGLEGLYLPVAANYLMIWTEGHPRIAARFEFMIDQLEDLNRPMLLLEVEDRLAARLHVNYVLDFLSLRLADRRGVDARDVPTIRRLKAFLAQQ